MRIQKKKEKIHNHTIGHNRKTQKPNKKEHNRKIPAVF
jgi:hypothetical protein